MILYSVVFEIWFSLRRVRRRERADVLDREQLARLFLPERVATVLAWSADARTPRDDVLALEDVMAQTPNSAKCFQLYVYKDRVLSSTLPLNHLFS
mgnify:CR=1 FL=1